MILEGKCMKSLLKKTPQNLDLTNKVQLKEDLNKKKEGR
jgi:hypothetical protein